MKEQTKVRMTFGGEGCQLPTQQCSSDAMFSQLVKASQFD